MDVSPVRLDVGHMAPSTAGTNAASDLERLFATFVVKELRNSLPDGFFGQGAGADVYEGWLEEHLGRSLADSGALDLAGRIKASIDSKARAEQSGADPR